MSRQLTIQIQICYIYLSRQLTILSTHYSMSRQLTIQINIHICLVKSQYKYIYVYVSSTHHTNTNIYIYMSRQLTILSTHYRQLTRLTYSCKHRNKSRYMYKCVLKHDSSRYRVAKTHRIPYLCRSFSAKEPYI